MCTPALSDTRLLSVLLCKDATRHVCNADLNEITIVPRAAAASTAAPEVLKSLIKGVSSSLHIAGPAADMWSTGAVLYHMLIGEPPFQPEPLDRPLSAACTASDLRKQEYKLMRAAQRSWVCTT